jgi:hypothetical protein
MIVESERIVCRRPALYQVSSGYQGPVFNGRLSRQLELEAEQADAGQAGAAAAPVSGSGEP